MSDAEVEAQAPAEEAVGETAPAPAEDAGPSPAEDAAAEEKKPAKTPRAKKEAKTPAAKEPAPAAEAGAASGKRERKKAESFQFEVKDKPEFVIPEGKGTKLGDIPNVKFLMGKQKVDSEVLCWLHRLLFKREGQVHKRRRNLNDFSGLVFPEGSEEDKELEKVKERLGKWPLPVLNELLECFELSKEGNKDAKISRIVEFLLEPKKLSDKDLAAAEEKKKEAAKRKREREATGKKDKKAKKEGGSSKKKGSEKKASKKDEDGGDKSGSDDEGSGSSDSASESEPEEEAKPAKKKSTPTPAKKKATPAKKPAAKKAKKEESEAEEDSDSDDDMPLGQAAKPKPPGDDELRNTVLSILKDVDVNSFSVKQLMVQLSTQFKQDLSARKNFVKEIAVEFARSQQEGADGTA